MYSNGGRFYETGCLLGLFQPTSIQTGAALIPLTTSKANLAASGPTRDHFKVWRDARQPVAIDGLLSITGRLLSELK